MKGERDTVAARSGTAAVNDPDGTLDKPPPDSLIRRRFEARAVACGEPPTCDCCNLPGPCTTCRRCRTHCRCTPGVDLRGSR